MMQAMNGAEILPTIAQLGLAITGFSGIAIAFNRQPGRLSSVEKFRVSILFANSLAAMFLALIPFALFYMEWSDAKIWRTGSALLALFSGGFLILQAVQVPRLFREHRQLFHLGQLAFVVGGHVINLIVQLLNALGLFRARLSIFILGLLWLLFHSAFQFGRILFVQPVASSANPDRRG
jgi:hypothetical protein